MSLVHRIDILICTKQSSYDYPLTKTRKNLQLLKLPDFPIKGMKRQQTILIYSGHGNYPGKRLFSDEGVSRGALFVV